MESDAALTSLMESETDLTSLLELDHMLDGLVKPVEESKPPSPMKRVTCLWKMCNIGWLPKLKQSEKYKQSIKNKVRKPKSRVGKFYSK